jgi:hypothetical protein
MNEYYYGANNKNDNVAHCAIITSRNEVYTNKINVQIFRNVITLLFPLFANTKPPSVGTTMFLFVVSTEDTCHKAQQGVNAEDCWLQCLFSDVNYYDRTVSVRDK